MAIPPPTQQDFPAAHSMDSTWWAVDGQGHVARVDTGEAGSIPSEAGEPPDEDEVLAQLAAAGTPFYCDDLFPRADGKLYLRDYRQTWDEASREPKEDPGDETYPYRSGFLLWLRDEAAIAHLASANPVAAVAQSVLQRVQRMFKSDNPVRPSTGWLVLRLSVADKVVVWVSAAGEEPAPTIPRVRELLATGDALCGWSYMPRLEVERFGLFGYGLETFDNWIAGPFERGAAPPNPLKFDVLPPAARNLLPVCPLPEVDFRREPLLQPFEHGEAHCWGEHWISTTGRQFRNEQHGPDLPGVSPPAALAVSAAGQSTLQALAAAYLSGEEGAADVLNDFLVEAGHPRISAQHEQPSQRLDELLLTLLAPEQQQAAATAFVEHALQMNPPPGEAAAAARAALTALNDRQAGRADAEQLAAAAGAALNAWMPDDETIDDEGPPRDNGVAWSAWALARGWPLVAARSARPFIPASSPGRPSTCCCSWPRPPRKTHVPDAARRAVWFLNATFSIRLMGRLATLQALINRRRFQQYLEIGVFEGQVFFKVKCRSKIAVDPRFRFNTLKKIRQIVRNPCNFNARYFETTSDSFFEQHAPQLFQKTALDLALIDGMHEFDHVNRDVQNTLKYLAPHGVLVLHDCNPIEPAAACSFEAYRARHFAGTWNGDVWKSILLLRCTRPDLHVFTADCDHGLGIIYRAPTPVAAGLDLTYEQIQELTYQDLADNRQAYLNLQPTSYLEQFVSR